METWKKILNFKIKLKVLLKKKSKTIENLLLILKLMDLLLMVITLIMVLKWLSIIWRQSKIIALTVK